MHSSETAAWTTAADLTGLGTCYGRLRRIKMDSALNLAWYLLDSCSHKILRCCKKTQRKPEFRCSAWSIPPGGQESDDGPQGRRRTGARVLQTGVSRTAQDS